MFCCVRKETHKGQIVAAVCLQSQCVKAKNQLSCVACLQQQHKGHSTTTMKKIVPDLLNAHSEKLTLQYELERLLQFIVKEFGTQFGSGEAVNRSNVVQRAQQLLQELKLKVQTNNEQMNKMKNIFKSLSKNNSQSFHKTSPSKYIQQSNLQVQNHKKGNASGLSSPANKSNQYVSPVKSKVFNNGSGIAEFDTFSITSKHPYLNLSNDYHSVTKVSHSGHRFAAIGAKPFSFAESQLRLKIDKSVSGNIMLGLCHQNIVRQKQFANCYGINNGTYLIGQNGNSALTAISFHHSLAVLNRKEVIGWNFQQGDEIIVGLNFEQQLVYFKREGKRTHVEFSMKLKAENKPQVNPIEQGLKLIVMLQSQGDQVSIHQI